MNRPAAHNKLSRRVLFAGAGTAGAVAALATVLLGAVAGLVLRVPAGLGVLEAVGVALLATQRLTAGDSAIISTAINARRAIGRWKWEARNMALF